MLGRWGQTRGVVDNSLNKLCSGQHLPTAETPFSCLRQSMKDEWALLDAEQGEIFLRYSLIPPFLSI